MSSNRRWAVGLMTGTVLDGEIDVALLATDGESVEAFGPAALVPYEAAVLGLLEEAVADARAWGFHGAEPASFARATAALTAAQSAAVASVLQAHGIAAEAVDVVGFHGQTVLHRAPTGDRHGRTRQLADGAAMARDLGLDVVTDFRTTDMAHGGQGAPLAPIYHRALLDRLGRTETAAFLNLGGVANITSAADDRLIAFDTGPANAPINDLLRARTGAAMDVDGAIAASGSVDEPLLARLLRHPYFAAPYPKSLDRFDFPATMVDSLGTADGAATLTAFAAGAIAKALELLPTRPRELVVGGGGRRNPALMRELGARTLLEVIDADALGLRGDMIEAECFALLAVRARRGLPLSFPTTTGVPRPLTGGVLHSAPQPQRRS